MNGYVDVCIGFQLIEATFLVGCHWKRSLQLNISLFSTFYKEKSM